MPLPVPLALREAVAATADKERYRIDGTTKRFEGGYNGFGRHAEKALSYLAKYTGSSRELPHAAEPDSLPLARLGAL